MAEGGHPDGMLCDLPALPRRMDLQARTAQMAGGRYCGSGAGPGGLPLRGMRCGHQ